MQARPDDEVASPAPRPAITSIGISTSQVCGVRDYAAQLSGFLASLGYDVDTDWVDADDLGARSSLAAAMTLLGTAKTAANDRVVLWHYSVFAYGYRGLPLPGVLAGLLLRARRRRVVGVMHELALSWGGGWRRNVLAAAQRLVLPLVVLGCDRIVVTTQARARWVGPLARLCRTSVVVIPVFANIRPAPAISRPSEGAGVGILGWAVDGIDVPTVVGSLAAATAGHPVGVVLLGAAGADSVAGRRWIHEAQRAGIADELSFSGVLGEADLSRRIGSCAVIVLPYSDGPSSRRTTVASALAHGRATLAFSPKLPWPALEEAGAIATATGQDFARSLTELLNDELARQLLSQRALAFYGQHLSPDVVGGQFDQLLSELCRVGR